MTSLGIAGALALLLAAPAPAAQSAAAAPGDPAAPDALTVAVERYGFRIRRPDSAWISYASAPRDSAAAYTLTLYPRDTPGLPSAVVYAKDDSTGVALADVREAAAAKLEREGATILGRGQSTLAGHPAISLRSRSTTATGLTYDAEIHYILVPPTLYAVQCNWASDSPRPALFDGLLDSFALFEARRPATDGEADTL